jgi:N-acyl-L-homoserine lactone synthetase
MNLENDFDGDIKNTNQNGYTIRTLKNYYDEAAIYSTQRLRYQIFCQELGWVLQNEDGREWDQYDIFAVHFAAFTDIGLAGYVRLIQPSPIGFMLENEFRRTLGNEELCLDKEHSVEISRLCIKTGLQNSAQITKGLYKAMYQWSKINNKTYWYIVVEMKYFLLLLRQCFPFKQIGPGYEYEEGILSVPAVLDLGEADKVLAAKRPKFLTWLTESHLRWEDAPEFELNGA